MKVTHPVCGDVVHLYARRVDEAVELAFEATACSAVIAFFSFCCETLSGRPIEELRHVAPEGLVESAGGLPPGKRHALSMVDRALSELLGRLEGGTP